MSLTDPPYGISYGGGPRASGDEPAVVTLDHCSPVWSPRERG